MKRFLVSSVLALVLIVAGVTTLFFEMRDFEVIYNNDNAYQDTLKDYRFQLDHMENLVIDADDNFDIRWINNENLGSEVIVRVSPILEVNKYGNHMEIDGYHFRFDNLFDMGSNWLDNLKERKIYLGNYEYDGMIQIECSNEMRSQIKVDY